MNEIKQVYKNYYEEEQGDAFEKIDDLVIDNYIEENKRDQAEIDRLNNLLEDKIAYIKSEYEDKIDVIKKRMQWKEESIKNAILLTKDKRETKTQWRKDFISGVVIVKKPTYTLIKPDVEGKKIKEKYPKYCKEITETVYKLDWRKLKENLIYDESNKRVVNTDTGEVLTDQIKVEHVPEKVIIK